MKPLIKSLKKTFLFSLIVATVAIIPFFICQNGANAASSLSLSLSIGLPVKGSLEQGEVLPSKGAGYQILSSTKTRKARFGTHELVMMLKDASFKVKQRRGGLKLQIGDLSKRKGGKFEHHASHQNGRDADINFYATDKNSVPVLTNIFTAFDRNGFSIDPPLKYRFDVERNWTLVKQLINSKYASVQWIFVANHLKKMLLEYAGQSGESPLLIRKASLILKQPKKNLHWDHFHVRIYCPENDKPSCKDFGPGWAWIK